MRRLLVGVVLALAVAGCGGDPKADPTPTPSSPSSSSTTPAPPVMPDAAKADTKAGAVAFVKYYVETQNFASATGDTAALERIAASECESCQSIIGLIKKVYAAGGHIDGDGWTILKAQRAGLASAPSNAIYVDVALRIASQSIYSTPSASPSEYPGNPRRLMTFGLSRASSGWRVANIVATAS